MTQPRSLSANEIVQFMRNLRNNVSVKKNFSGQVKQVDSILSNDKTGIITPIYDFMVHASTVSMKIETNSENLNNFLKNWQNRVLNRNVNIDIPGGMRELSAQYFKERWRSSLVALQVIWGEETFNNRSFVVPKKMWFLDGGAVFSQSSGSLNTKKYFIKSQGDTNEALVNGIKKSIFIRRPYNSWHQDITTPYLVRRGTLFNGLFKSALKMKQSDLVEAIVPYLLSISAGTDAMTQYAQNLLPDQEDLKKLKDKFLDSKQEWNMSRDLKDLIATLRYDTKFEHLIPDLSKFINTSIMQPIDRDLLSSLGMIEMVGFSSNREEAILNPKVLIEEVTDAVADWSSLLEDVIFEMLERNKTNSPKLVNNDVKVIPGTVKAFITDDMRSMMRGLYDRGVISKQNIVEDLTSLSFETQVDRRKKEKTLNLDDVLFPPAIQNMEIKNNDQNLEKQNKKPGSPESKNFDKATTESFDTIDELPEEIKNKLPFPAQLIWLKAFNKRINECDSQIVLQHKAWDEVKDKYKPGKKIKWVKK